MCRALETCLSVTKKVWQPDRRIDKQADTGQWNSSVLLCIVCKTRMHIFGTVLHANMILNKINGKHIYTYIYICTTAEILFENLLCRFDKVNLSRMTSDMLSYCTNIKWDNVHPNATWTFIGASQQSTYVIRFHRTVVTVAKSKTACVHSQWASGFCPHFSIFVVVVSSAVFHVPRLRKAFLKGKTL